MALTKITPEEISQKGVCAAPDRLTGTAAENKAVFDRLIREVVAGDFNGLVDALTAATGASEIGATVAGMTEKSVQALLAALKAALDAGDADTAAHKANLANPHKVTKEQVGLGSVDNTSDANKPVSIAQKEFVERAVNSGGNVTKEQAERWDKTDKEEIRSPRTAAPTLKTRTTDIATVTIKGNTPEGSTEGVGTGGSVTFVATNGIDTNTATLPLTEPLRRLGEVCDEYDGKTGKLTRRLGLLGETLTVLPQPVISYHRADLACYDGDTTVSCSDPLATDMEVTVYDIRPAGDARTLGGDLPHIYMQSNPNVLVNGSFTVNQRGFTSVTNVYDAYGVDCWRFSGGTNDTWTIKKDDGTYLHCTAPAGRATNKQAHIRQWFEADLRGKQVTISMECWNRSDESAHSSCYFWDGATSTGGPDIDTVRIPNSDHWIVVHKTFVVPKTFGDEYQSLIIRPAWQTEAVKIDLKVRRVKIELGPVSTLHLDPPPNPALELAKCQRYLLPLKTDASFAGRTRSANAAQILATIPTPVQMRVNPALTGGLAFNAAKDNVFKPITSVSTIAGSNCILLSGEVGAGYTQGAAITAYAISYGYLSAEL